MNYVKKPFALEAIMTLPIWLKQGNFFSFFILVYIIMLVILKISTLVCWFAVRQQFYGAIDLFTNFIDTILTKVVPDVATTNMQSGAQVLKYSVLHVHVGL